MRVGGRWAWVVGLVVVAAAVAVSAGRYTWPIDPGLVAAELNTATAPHTGMRWSRPAKAMMSLLPWPTLHLSRVELRTALGATVLTAPRLAIGLRPVELLQGRLSPTTATLTNPTIVLDLDAAGLDASSPPPVERVELRGGVVKVVSATRGLDTEIEHLDGRFEWRKSDRPLSFGFTGMWRGQRVSGACQIDSPLLLAGGAPSDARLTLASSDADFAFVGRWSTREKNEFDGDVTARVRSRDSLRRWIGVETAPLIDAQEFAFHGRATGSASSLLLRDARLELDGQTLEGSLSLEREGDKLSASGTLAADDLDLAALFGPRPRLFNAAGEWSHAEVIPKSKSALDLDLRVSAAHVSWNGPAIDDVALSVLRRDGGLTLKMLEASAYRGALTGEISVGRGGNAIETRASLALEGADCGALLQDWGVNAYSGLCDLDATLSAAGGSPAEIAASANGSAKIELQDGSVAGINFEEALRRSQRRPIEVARDMVVGQTKFASARARVEIGGGEARIAEATAQGPGMIFAASGAIGLVARDWRVKILATQASGLGVVTPDSTRLAFTLSGPWTAPTLATSGED